MEYFCLVYLRIIAKFQVFIQSFKISNYTQIQVVKQMVLHELLSLVQVDTFP